ncbi:MAG: zinc ribbon domain-containing protein [Actinomyces sp.]|nr:zinc ribbon domain-containing protein [Actinomyces sp.]MDU1522028.1 zinc ribbon domain-containing protein [Actinomyces sp.]MDU2984163.1 zinc ribbon domain-containing protein [Actinomyces sp.]
MKYEDPPTIQARMDYHLTNFLLENLAVQSTVEWMDAFCAHRHAAKTLGITDRELPWLATRVDPRGHKSFGWRMSGKIICGDCGRAFGHKTWHSGTPNRVDVWECPTNYVKRGTCATSHLYQEVLLVQMAEALQVLAERNRVAVDLVVDSLKSTGVRRRSSTLRTAIDKLLTESPTQLALHIPDFLAVLEGGCMLTDGRLGFVFITGEAVTLDLPQRWSPVMRPGELAATRRC